MPDIPKHLQLFLPWNGNICGAYCDKYVDSMHGLSLDDISQAAKDYVKPDNLVWVVVGDRAKIEEEVRSLEYGMALLCDYLLFPF